MLRSGNVSELSTSSQSSLVFAELPVEYCEIITAGTSDWFNVFQALEFH